MPSLLQHWYYELYDTAHAWYRGLRHNPRWLLMRQLSRFTALRDWMKRSRLKRSPSFAAQREVIVPQAASVFPDLAIAPIVQTLQRDGYCLGLQLPPAILQSMLEFADQQPCLGNRYADKGFYYAQKAAAEAHYQTAFITASYFNTATDCPAIARLGQDPVLRSIAAQYLAADPVLISSRLWWSFPGRTGLRDRRKSAQMFHCDLDDYAFLKFFFYLTDVDAAAGPHVCVRGTHRRKQWRHEWFGKQFEEAEILRAYGAVNLRQICGKAGAGFVEDPFCLHRASVPLQRDRLILQLEYALQDYGMERDQIDPRQVRVFVAQRNAAGSLR